MNDQRFLGIILRINYITIYIIIYSNHRNIVDPNLLDHTESLKRLWHINDTITEFRKKYSWNKKLKLASLYFCLPKTKVCYR